MNKLRALSATLFGIFILGAITALPAWASGPPVNTAPPPIIGTREVGAKLTGFKGTWTNEPTSYAYQWRRCSSAGTECVNITGATEFQYVLVEADRFHTIVLRVTAFNSSGQGSADSITTVVIGPPKAAEIIPAPTQTNQLAFSASDASGQITVFKGTNYEALCHATMVGRFINATEAREISIHYTECSGIPSFNSEPLEGKLGYVNGSTTSVALRLRPVGGSNIFARDYFFAHAEDKLEGLVFGAVTPLATATKTFTLKYAESAGHQEILGFEKPNEGQLSGHVGEITSPVNLKATYTMFVGRSVEIR
jgi:hypothetical protein